MKKIISILLTVSMIFAPLSALAEKPDIILTEEYSTDFSYDVSNANLPSIDIAEEVPQEVQVMRNAQENAVNYAEYTGAVLPEILADESAIDISCEDTEASDGIVGRTASQSPILRSASAAGDTQYRLNNINGKDSFALQNQVGRTSFVGDDIGEEYIDPLTGNLIVTETDLVLPGVDGLDLRLERYYSLAEAELYTKTSKLNNDAITFTMPEDSYVVVESVYDRETGQTSEYRYPYAQRSEAELRKEEIESRDTNNGNFIYNATIRNCNEGDEVYVPYYYTSEITSSSYQRTRNNLGAGWSWGFPSVQIIKNNYADATEIPKGLYYHDGKGNVIEVEYNGNGEYSFANHIGKDIIFEDYFDYDSAISSSGRIDYIVTDADSKKYYFGTRGELLTILDRFGNKITFNYTNKNFYGANNSPLISSITDSVGRKVKFTYSGPGDYETLTLTITSTMETGKELTLSYEKKMVEVLQDGETLSTEPVLVSVTNTMGETTSYYPMVGGNERKYAYPVKFTFADKKLDSGFVINTSGARNNLVYLLGNIVRPHSDTYYEYDIITRNLGHSGVSEAYRITERGDYELTIDSNNTIDETYLKNRIQYRYTNDYTGYPRNCSIAAAEEGRKVCGTREIHSKSQVSRDYYKTDEAALLKYTYETYTEPEGSQLSRNSEVVGYLFKRPVRTKITYSNDSEYSYDSYVQNEFETGQNRAFGRPTLTTAEVDYDTVIGTNRKRHAVVYTYDETTGFAKSKSWYRDENTKCTEYYRYNSDQRLQEVTQADGTTTNYSYEYAGNGKISKKITTVTNGTMSTVTEENYTSATGYTYPTTVKRTVKGKNISGEDISQTQTVTYTYNMLLGTIASETDNNGNTTYYEYDELARPIRIVYPKYSAYSNVNEKDLSILPVKNISYRNVIHTDYAGITDAALRLVVQGVQTTDKYYDVSDISENNPSDDALSECSLYYIGDEIDYYTGTGELIEENTFDKIGTNYTYLKTSHIYDTRNNIKTTIDPDGNTTKVYYDDLGRTVKTVDVFDNYHITEYNKNSDTAGFSAMSYFVPANDRTAKQNITECKYDRLQRVISEKAYESYPESYSEVQYVYDIAGNIIGTTDAEGNTGSSGYTVSCTYDNLNRVITSKNANDEVIKNSYDIFGNITKQTITSASGEESILYRREYDGEGKLLSDTDNAENSNIYTYNALGQLEAVKDKNGQFLHAEFNEDGVQDRNYITRIGVAISDEQYQYITPFGASMTIKAYARYNAETDKYTGSLSEVRVIDYSPTGKILNDSSKYFYATGVENVFFYPEAEYTYDEIGNVTSAEYSCIDEVNEKKYTLANYYEYDKNRISKVQVTEGERNTADSANASYEFYPDGKLKSVTYPPLSDGSVLESEYTYDGLSRLIGLTNKKGSTVLSSYNYSYDENGNILTSNEMVEGVSNTVSYDYDKLNRIASVSGTKGADSYYEYDYRGNRKVNFEQIDFLSEESAEFRYNEQDQMYYAEVGDDAVYIEYDASGYRYVKESSSSGIEYYIYDQNGRLQAIADLAEVIANGTTQYAMCPVKQYIWGPDRVLAQVDKETGEIYYYIYNGHGDVVQIVDRNGNIKNRYDYDVWGNFLTKDETIENHFTYFGQTYDEETGLYYLRARYYDPTIGRFTQQDPAEDGYNWYVYGNQNPVMYVDCTGESISVAAGIGVVASELIKYGAAILGGVAIGNSITYFAKKSKTSKKERATDIPSWAKGEGPKEGESGKDYAKRLCDERYGEGNYNTGPNSEYNKLKKHGDRGGK